MDIINNLCECISSCDEYINNWTQLELQHGQFLSVLSFIARHFEKGAIGKLNQSLVSILPVSVIDYFIYTNLKFYF